MFVLEFIKKETKNWREFSKFVFVGILNTGLGYLLFALFIYVGIFYLLSMTISHILTVIHSYFWNRSFTFKSKGSYQKELPKFFVVYTIVYFLNFILLYITVGLLKLNVYVSQVFILGFVVVTSFCGQRYWTFKKSS